MRMQKTLSEVYHDVNNTLSIISGNAQLLKELARAQEMGEPFVEPLEDIQTARAEISEALDRLDRVRQRLGSPSGERSAG